MKSKRHYFSTTGLDGEIVTTYDVRFHVRLHEDEAHHALYKAVETYILTTNDTIGDMFDSMLRHISITDEGIGDIKEVIVPEHNVLLYFAYPDN